MTSLKTTIVVTVLLVVGYSVYQALYDTPGSTPKQPSADDSPRIADGQRSAGGNTSDQYPARATGKQAVKRAAGSRFATGSAPDAVADPDDRAGTKSTAGVEDPFRRNTSRDASRSPDDRTARDRTELDRRLPAPAGAPSERTGLDGTASDRTAASRSALDRAIANSVASERTAPERPAPERTASDRAGVAAGAASFDDGRSAATSPAKSARGRAGWNFAPNAVSARGRTETIPNDLAAARDDAAPGRATADRRAAASATSPQARSEAAPKAAASRSIASRTIAPKAAAPNEVRPGFQAMMDRANRLVDEGQLAKVLRDLTPWFARADLLPAESRRITDMLDQLAGTVVYSRQHLMEPAYVVEPNENLYQVAQKYLVPWQLLAKINNIRDPNQLTAGRKLKVVRGPFDATVYLERRELALFVDNGKYYAGRFPIGVGRDQPQLEGIYVVRKKDTQKAYEVAGGVIPPGDPRNPLGRYYIELDERIGLHGTNDPAAIGRADGRGNVALADRDVEDVFDILTAESHSSPGSKVTILR